MASVKFSDLMKTRLTGPDVEYTDWLRRFEVAIKVTKASDQDAVALMQAWLEGPCQEEAEEFLRKWEELEAVPNTAPAMRLYYKRQLAGLKDHLGRAAAVVGTAPEARLMLQWRTMMQKPKESVQEYYLRLRKVANRLAKQKQPVRLDPTQMAYTFVTGLQPRLRTQVRLSANGGPLSMEAALEAAEIAETAYAADTPHEADTDGLHELNRRFNRQSLAEPRSRAVRSVQDPDHMGEGGQRKFNSKYGPGAGHEQTSSANPTARYNNPRPRPAVGKVRSTGPGSIPQVCLN